MTLDLASVSVSPASVLPARRAGAAPRVLAARLRATTLTIALAAASAAAVAQGAPRLHAWPDADLALGERLIREHRCAECHARKTGGDAASIYRPLGRINTPAALRGMVDLCSTELNLGLFPEEVSSVAAVLQRDHYRFPAAAPQAPSR